jgi:hypothetical protein
MMPNESRCTLVVYLFQRLRCLHTDLHHFASKHTSVGAHVNLVYIAVS